MPLLNDRRVFLKSSAASSALLLVLDRLEKVAATFSSSASVPMEPSSEKEFVEMGRHYLLDPEIVYLNHASIGTIPRPVIEARQEYLEICETNPWLYMWGGVWDELREGVREQCASLLGCGPGEVCITHNTTEVFNMLAHGLPLQPGDEVLCSTLCHVGASQAFQHMGPRRGYTARQFDFPVQQVENISAEEMTRIYVAQVTPKTRLVLLPHIDNTVGIRYPVRAMAMALKDAGVKYVAVDAAQSVGMIPVNVSEWNVDVVATSPHKWLQAPKGLGLGYIRKELHELLQPMWVTWGQSRWPANARRFEDYGTRNMAEVLTLKHAIEFLSKLDSQKRVERLQNLWSHARKIVDRDSRLQWRSPSDWQMGASLFAIEVMDRSSADLAETLFRDHGVVVRPFSTLGLNTLRVSPNVFTSQAQLDRFFELLT